MRRTAAGPTSGRGSFVPHPPPTESVTRLVDSRYAVRRLLVALALMTIGNGGMYVVVVVLPAVQAEFNSPCKALEP